MIKMKNLVLVLFVLLVNLKGFSNNNESKISNDILTETGKANETIQYHFQFKNKLKNTETFYLSVDRPRELVCENSLNVSEIKLKSGELFKGILSVLVSDRMPEGGHESSTVIIKNSKGTFIHKKEFITVRTLPHPFLLVTNSVFNEAKQKIKDYDWAKQNLNKMLLELNEFEFPARKIITKPRPTKVWSSLAYVSSDGEQAFKLGLAWRLTQNEAYKQKLIDFIKQVCDKDKGYLSVGAATTGVQVHEGNFFLFLAAACDIVFNEPELTTIDRENIENTFRFYLKQNRSHMQSLGIMNHQASANAGAIVVALFLQDIPELNHLIEAEGGIADQIGKGVMADGWWFEGTANYCYLVTQRYSLVAQAFENYGLDLYHRRFPVKFKSVDFENSKSGFTGMKFDNWGPPGKNTRGLEDMVTPYIPMMDENAYVVSTNDSNLKEPNEFYEFAYRAYKKPELAWVINKTNRASWVSLMYGLPNLPKIEDPRTASAFMPNVGLTVLRSQPEDKTPESQIQAYLKYGTHGGWHGHFDRASLVALNRNGHKYFGTEMVWYGYGKAGYKESVQTSATHNMVIVDELQQEAVPSKQLLFFKGEIMEASAVETNARWREIPRFNLEKFPPWNDKAFDADFNPIQQRRLAIVTNDYVVIADYMKSNKKHNYDWLIHPVGLTDIEGVKKTGPTLEQLSQNLDSPYKYFKDAQWYKANKGVKIKFDEYGNKLDVYSLWPKRGQVLVSSYPNGGKQRDIRNNPNRKTYGLRINDKEVVFLNVLVPYQGENQIEKIESKSDKELTVFLKDGRKQHIIIDNFKSSDFEIIIEVYQNNSIIKTEIAHSKSF
jgi:hypothetical protein